LSFGTLPFPADAGIAVDLIQSGSSAKSAQEAAAGSVDIGTSSTFDIFRAIDAGANLKIFLDTQAVGTFQLFATKTISKFSDLKGKRVVTGGPKDITTLYWNAAAQHFGLDPKTDVELIYSGASSARFAALAAHAVDGAVLSPPLTFVAASQGFANLGLIASYLGDFPTNVWYANTKWASTHEKELVAFAAANDRGAKFLLDPANRRAAAAILAKASNISLDEALKTYDLCVTEAKAYLPDGDVKLSGLERVRSLLDEAGDLQKPLKPLSVYFDGRYIAKARAIAEK
jgi:ABC-type nitrate/sulfonate/bicarbonate transport system substrate-binding protein